MGVPVEDLLEHRPVELLLGLEVAVDDEPGHADLGGDVVHRGAREARAGEGAGGAAQDRLLPFVSAEQLAGLHDLQCILLC